MIHRINESIEDHIEWDLYDFVSFFWAGNGFLNWKEDFLKKKWIAEYQDLDAFKS